MPFPSATQLIRVFYAAASPRRRRNVLNNSVKTSADPRSESIGVLLLRIAHVKLDLSTSIFLLFSLPRKVIVISKHLRMIHAASPRKKKKKMRRLDALRRNQRADKNRSVRSYCIALSSSYLIKALIFALSCAGDKAKINIDSSNCVDYYIFRGYGRIFAERVASPARFARRIRFSNRSEYATGRTASPFKTLYISRSTKDHDEGPSTSYVLSRATFAYSP